MGKLLLALGLLLTAACVSGAGRLPPPADDAPAEVRGQYHYEQACQRCHALYMPGSYTAAEWKFYVRKYGRRARLDADEKALVLTYLKTGARAE